MKFKITGKFGELSEVRNMKPHSGLDFSMSEGTTLRSIGEGVVEAVRDYGAENIGKGVIIRLQDGTAAIYGHMSKISVSPGDKVDLGTVIGKSGSTGNSTAPHLHFGLQSPDGSFIDPTPVADIVANLSGKRSFMDWIKDRGAVDQYNPAAQENGNWFWNMVLDGLHNGMVNFWDWFILNLPDFMMYGGVLTGICMILSAAIGRGVMKPFAIYAILLIIAAVILGGV